MAFRKSTTTFKRTACGEDLRTANVSLNGTKVTCGPCQSKLSEAADHRKYAASLAKESL